MRSSRRAGQRGAAAVEFALVLPFLMLIVLGTIDWGYFFFVEQIVTNAAREGARVGSLTPNDPAAPDPAADATAVAEAEGTAETYLTNAGLSAANATIAAVNDGNAVVVTVSYTTGSITGFLDLVPLMPDRANAVARMRR
jgi:Flp pilus assembly protein TadG